MSKVNVEKDNFFYKKILAGDYICDGEVGVIYNKYGKSLGTVNSRGYVTLGALNNGKLMIIQAHRVMWMAYFGMIPDGLVPNHIDTNKQNNKIRNLELITDAENSKHSFENGLNPIKGRISHNAILTEERVRIIRIVYKKKSKKTGKIYTISRLAKIFKVEKYIIKSAIYGYPSVK